MRHLKNVKSNSFLPQSVKKRIKNVVDKEKLHLIINHSLIFHNKFLLIYKNVYKKKK